MSILIFLFTRYQWIIHVGCIEFVCVLVKFKFSNESTVGWVLKVILSQNNILGNIYLHLDVVFANMSSFFKVVYMWLLKQLIWSFPSILFWTSNCFLSLSLFSFTLFDDIPCYFMLLKFSCSIHLKSHLLWDCLTWNFAWLFRKFFCN